MHVIKKLEAELRVFLILFIEDLSRLVEASIMSFVDENREQFFSPRRRFVSQIAFGIATIPFASLLYGMYRGKYNYKVLKYALEFDDLPEAFDGFTITQISDIHSGSFTNAEKVKYAVDLVNEQNSDVVLFTGDLVNNVVEEMDQWKSVFSTIKAKDGVFSVLGNHDYGDYVKWESAEAKETNLNSLKKLQKN